MTSATLSHEKIKCIMTNVLKQTTNIHEKKTEPENQAPRMYISLKITSLNKISESYFWCCASIS